MHIRRKKDLSSSLGGLDFTEYKHDEGNRTRYPRGSRSGVSRKIRGQIDERIGRLYKDHSSSNKNEEAT